MVDHRTDVPIPPVGDCDGIILFENPDFTMRIFNADGSEAEMCGNGLRCFIQFLIDLGIKKEIYTIKTLSGQLQGWEEEGEIVVTLPQPTPPQKLHIDGYTFFFLTVGVPHAVCMDPIDDFTSFGKKYLNHPAFGPKGSNINHATICDGILHVRTFERGVNRETGACGTGSLASAVVSKLPSPIRVQTSSKEILTLTVSPPTLRGKVTRSVLTH